jgi:hypothetical protein
MTKQTAVLPPSTADSEAALRAAVVARAKALAGKRIRESNALGNNRGEPFDSYNCGAGVALGSPYCVSLWHYELARVFAEHGAELPLRIGASTSLLAARAKKLGRLRDAGAARPGDLVLFRNAAGKYFHTGLCVERQVDGKLRTVEGNTSPARRVIGEGGGVYARTRDPRAVKCEVVDVCA